MFDSKLRELQIKLGDKHAQYIKAQYDAVEARKLEMRTRDEMRAIEKEITETYKSWKQNVSCETMEG